MLAWFSYSSTAFLALEVDITNIEWEEQGDESNVRR